MIKFVRSSSHHVVWPQDIGSERDVLEDESASWTLHCIMSAKDPDSELVSAFAPLGLVHSLCMIAQKRKLAKGDIRLPSKPIPTDLHQCKREKRRALSVHHGPWRISATHRMICRCPPRLPEKPLLEQERVYVKSVHCERFSVLSCLKAAVSRGRDLAMDATL